MHPRIQRLVFAATVVTLTACGGDVPVSPVDTFNRSGADGAAAYAVTLGDGTKQIGVGESVTLRGGSSASRGRTLRWSSSTTSVVSVTSSGTISGRAVGAATVTARGSNGTSSQFRISVISMSTRTAPVVAVVEIAVPSSTMPVAGTMTLSATARDGDGVAITGRPVTWSASGSAVTVSSTGVVTAVAAGSAVVRATVDGVAGSTSIVVVAPTVASLTISPKTGATLAPGATRQFSTSATWSDLATRAVSVTYTATGGTISSNGLYTAGQLIGTFMVIANCACGRADTAAVSITSVSVPAQLTRLAISPKTATVNAGATQQFAATANWSTGATTLPPVTYSATGGSVTSAGLYTAPSTGGTYRVIVAHSGGTLRDTATVTVPGTGTGTGTSGGTPVSQLSISPSTVTVAPGGSQQFSVSARWSNGSVTVPPVRYSAAGGSVTAAGLYTAPTVAGLYRVIAVHTAGPLRDTAFVMVQGSPAPLGGTMVFFDGFESGDLDRVQNNVSWTSHPWVDASPAIARSGTYSARFKQGASTNFAELRFGRLPSLPEVFLQFDLYQPSGREASFVGPAVSVPVPDKNDKFFRLWGGSYTNATVGYGASTWGIGSVGHLGTEFNRSDGTRLVGMGEGGAQYNKSNRFPLMGAPEYAGRWVRVRIRSKVASAANNDGVMQIWLDNTMIYDRRDLASYAVGGVGNAFTEGYLLGWANSGFPPGQIVYIDNVAISTGGFVSP